MAILPPWLMLAIMSRKACGLPRHLQANVEAFRHAELLLHFGQRCLCGIDGERRAHLARQFQAEGFTSVMTTWRAPAWRTTAAAMMPMGPAPVISTSSPSTGNESAVCTALPKGSKMAATSWSTLRMVAPDVGHRQRDEFGESAGTIHADALVLRAEMPAAGKAVAAAAADHVAFAADDVAGEEVVDVGADRDDLADELVADRHRHRDGLLRPFVPVVDVDVGTADAGVSGRGSARR